MFLLEFKSRSNSTEPWETWIQRFFTSVRKRIFFITWVCEASNNGEVPLSRRNIKFVYVQSQTREKNSVSVSASLRQFFIEIFSIDFEMLKNSSIILLIVLVTFAVLVSIVHGDCRSYLENELRWICGRRREFLTLFFYQ